MTKPPTNLRSFEALIEIVAHLRGPNGCPWDKEQTHQSLAPFAIEEVYEMVETISAQTDHAFKDELGDVLFQVALHAQLANERQAFNINDIIENLNTKMIRRHPHVFGEEKVESSQEVLKNWDSIKAQEKELKTSVAQSAPSKKAFGIPLQLPALQRAFKIGSKCHRSGFDWKGPEDVRRKVLEELAEVDEAVLKNNERETAEELGDLLFAVSQWVRHLGQEPESCLRLANNKFERRYFKMQELCEVRKWDFDSLTDHEKDQLWMEVKTLEKEDKLQSP